VTTGPNANLTVTADPAGTYRFEALQTGAITLVARAMGHIDSTRNVTISGTSSNTLNFTLAQVGPRTQFGAGQYRVGTGIVAGRYYADPLDGCYWERQSGLGGTLGEIIDNEFVAFNAAQIIVDILPSDLAFETNEHCGTWFNTPRRGLLTNIIGGRWLVGSQVAPGTYQTSAAHGCYWERLRAFDGKTASIIANKFVETAGTQFVTIASGDVGFHTDAECGTWTKTNALVSPSYQSRVEIESNSVRHKQRVGGRR